MKYNVRPIRGHNPWLVRPRPQRGDELAGVMLHATRGGRGMDADDADVMENWAQSSANGSAEQGWGSSWDEYISRDTGERVVMTDYQTEYPSWGAGYGGSGTWGAAFYYYQIELCQTRPDQPYTDVLVDSAAERTAQLAKRHGFPIERIPFLHQTGTPPRGICSHEDSANGRKLGKSDPGELFPWDDYLARCRAYMGDVEGQGGDVEDDRIDALEREVAKLRRDYDRLNDVLVGARFEVIRFALREDVAPVEQLAKELREKGVKP